jgi:prepilin-type N-terminal cleavage/methylation domain-containing protein
MTRATAPARRRAAPRAARQAGFTLFETIIVIALLALVAGGLLAMQPQVHKVQSEGRDEVAGLDLMRACAERLLAIRRSAGYASVDTADCNGVGGSGGFASNPSVALKDASNATISSCSSATCTATISVTKTSGTVALVPLTLQFSSY